MSRAIDVEKAIEIIETKQKELCPVGRYGRNYVYGSDREKYDAWEEIVDTLENLPTLTPPNEWVSVDERLPEPEFDWQQRGFYLVALSNGVVKELAYEFRHYENMIFDVGWHETAHPVTHWMSLPEPPAKES